MLDRGIAYTHAQEIFTSGLVTIVGSGASAAYGLPGMGELAAHLKGSVEPQIEDGSDALKAEWAAIAARLEAGDSLETALGAGTIADALADVITREIAICVGAGERTAIDLLISGARPTEYGRLLEYLLRASKVADVVTTNYDRLIEVSAALDGVRVDTMFYGHTVGRLDERLSREELTKSVTQSGRRSPIRLNYHPHIRLAKPHGSLDWFAVDGEVFRSDLGAENSRRIVAPGGNKYRIGYDLPYDQQRQRANSAVDAAASFLSIGYGFNDDHLQTHLRTKFAAVPTVILARTLTPQASAFASSSNQCLTISAATGGGTRLSLAGDDVHIDEPIWRLGHFLSEVLSV